MRTVSKVSRAGAGWGNVKVLMAGKLMKTALLRETLFRALSGALIGACLSGCATGASNSAAAESTSSAPFKFPASLSPGSGAALAPASEQPTGTATEVYRRIAQGANTCWFGGAGPLKKDYIYHAQADAPSRGGNAEIIVHVRDPSQPNPRGAKAFKINVVAKGDEAEVKTGNLKMAANVAAAMASDVDRWSKGDQGCANASTATAAGWSPAAEAPAAIVKAAAPEQTSKVKQKAKTASTALQPKP